MTCIQAFNMDCDAVTQLEYQSLVRISSPSYPKLRRCLICLIYIFYINNHSSKIEHNSLKQRFA
jgi:hypothetical protein